MQNDKRSSWFLNGWLLLTLLLFYPGIFLVRGAWIVGDHAEQHYPWAVYLAGNLKHFRIPFWTDLLQAGFPITAEGQIGSFYLPNILFYLPLPIQAGYAWNILFHLFLSGFFMAKFLRSLNLSPKAAAFGLLIYMYSSALGGAFYNITSLKVLCWFPAALLTIDWMWKGGKLNWKAVPLLGFLFSLQILAGYLQFATYAIFFALLYGVLRIWETLASEKRPALMTGIALGGAVILSAILSFPQLLLTFQLALSSNRSGVAESFAYIGSFPPLALVCLIFPSLEGLFAGKLYLGILPLFFVTLALFRWPEKPFRAIVILCAVSLLLALGQFSPLYIFIVKVLHFHSFRTPIKFIFFTGFFASILAAYGMDSLLKDAETKIRRAFSAYIGWIVFCLLSAVFAFIAFRFFPETLNNLGEWLVNRFIYGKPGHPYGWDHYQDKLQTFVAGAADLLNPAGEVIRTPLLKIAMCSAVLLLFIQKRIRLSIFYFVSVALVLADLFSYSFADVQRDYAPYESFYEESPTAQFLKSNLREGRYFIYSNDPSSSPLPAGKSMRFRLKTANAYSPLISKQYYDYMGALGGVNDSTGSFPIDDAYLAQNLEKLQRLSVKYILTDRDLDATLGGPAFRENRWRTYLLQSSRPLAYWKEETGFANIRFLEDSEERVRLEVYPDTAQTLIFARRFEEGWKVWVDGKPSEIHKSDIFMAVSIPPGQHAVVLRYHPFHGTVPFLKKLFSKSSS